MLGSDNKVFDQSMPEGTYDTCSAAADRDADLLVRDPLRVMLPLLLYIKSESLLKARFGFCSLLCRVVFRCVLPRRTMVKALALSLIW